MLKSFSFWFGGHVAGLRYRFLSCVLFFLACFVIIFFRLGYLMFFATSPTQQAVHTDDVLRGTIYDRRGSVLATSLPVMSAYVHPHEITDKESLAFSLAAFFEDSDGESWRRLLASERPFVWLRRGLTQQAYEALVSWQLEGVRFRKEVRRFYPHAAITAHVVGFTNIDQRGLAGIERALDERLRLGENIYLSLDMRFQTLLHNVLTNVVERYQAQSAVGILLSADDARVLGIVSLPDFNSNQLRGLTAQAQFHRATHGVYELGSLLKLFALAHALERGIAPYERHYAVGDSLMIGDLEVRDNHLDRALFSPAELLIHSSNVGAARLVLSLGRSEHLEFLARFHFMESLDIVLRERGSPLYQSDWQDDDWIATSYGYSLALSPLHMAAAVAALVNGGFYMSPQFVYDADSVQPRYSVISQQTSVTLRHLMRDVVLYGTGRLARLDSVPLGGKTGTALKISHGDYDSDKLLLSFVAAFPIDDPHYVLLVMLDEPQRGDVATMTGGSVMAPVAAKMARHIMAIAPKGVAPKGVAAGGVKQGGVHDDPF